MQYVTAVHKSLYWLWYTYPLCSLSFRAFRSRLLSWPWVNVHLFCPQSQCLSPRVEKRAVPWYRRQAWTWWDICSKLIRDYLTSEFYKKMVHKTPVCYCMSEQKPLVPGCTGDGWNFSAFSQTAIPVFLNTWLDENVGMPPVSLFSCKLSDSYTLNHIHNTHCIRTSKPQRRPVIRSQYLGVRPPRGRCPH